MKKKFIFLLLLVSAMVTATSCQKEMTVETVPGQETIDVCIDAVMGEYLSAAKAELVNTVRVSWKGDEKVYVFDKNRHLGCLTAALDEGEDSYAKLSGTILVPGFTTKYLTFICSSMDINSLVTSFGQKNHIEIPLSEQTGNKAPFVAYATLPYISGSTSFSNCILPFRFATSVVRVNCSGLDRNMAIKYATLSGVKDICRIPFNSENPAVKSVSGENAIVRNNGDTGICVSNSEGEAVFSICLPVQEESSEGSRSIVVTQSDDKNFCDRNFSVNPIGAGVSVNTVCGMIEEPGPEYGALSGIFSIGVNKKVHFSRGNLQATYVNPSADYTYQKYSFSFAAAQYDNVGDSPGNTSLKSQVLNSAFDSFSWSVNGSHKYYRAENDYGIIYESHSNKFAYPYEEWGKQIGDGWYTMSDDEWEYLISDRSKASELLKNNVSVCGKTGCLILLPDDWIWETKNVGSGWLDRYDETTTPSWSTMEAAGAVCLPAAGIRGEEEDEEQEDEGEGSKSDVDMSDVDDVGVIGSYWSRTEVETGLYEDPAVRCLVFDKEKGVRITSVSPTRGRSVRLVINSK